jgi:DNA polymerase-1
VHPNYNHCGVVSSRTACSSPNLLQFPSRFELKKLKQCMVVPEGRKLIGFDYSSCEVMVVSALSKEPNFLEAIKNGWDFHSNTAYNVFKEKMVIPVELTDKKQILDYIKKNYSLLRQYSKGCLFGLIYGIQEGGLSKNLGVTKSEAKEIIDSFFMGNKTLEKYLDEQKMLVTKKGYVENYYGQRVYLPTLKGFNPKKNTFKKDWSKISALRFVNNYLIQSGNAFLLYDGLIKLNEIIKNKQLDVKFLTTVYDSLYLDLSESTDLKEIVSILKECFEVDFFGVKMKIDISGSDTGRWYDWENIDLNFKED